MRNVEYLKTSLWKRLTGRGLGCPSCGFADPGDAVDRKWVITSLHRCRNCRLLFRAPTTTPSENEHIYQSIYEEGFTTDLPDEGTLGRLLADGFAGSQKDYSTYVEVLRAIGLREGAKVFDFGCSWGYGSYQLGRAGFDVEAFEISRDRARFAAERLGVRIRRPEEIPAKSYDVFFSAHVLEHVPCVSEVLELSDRLLRPGGWFVAFTPNGSSARRRRDPDGWHKSWGFVHPQLLDREWLDSVDAGRLLIADTDPYDLESIRAGRSPSKWDGSELFFSMRKPHR